MIYQVKKTDFDNEFLVNTMVTIKIIEDENKKPKTQMTYDQKLLTQKEATLLSKEFMTYFSALNQ